MSEPDSANTRDERLADGRYPALADLLPFGLAATGAGLIGAMAVTYLFLAHPAMDDFCRAATGLGEALQATEALYRHHTGRWLVSLLHAVMQPRIGIDGIGYSLALGAMMIAWFCGFLIGAGLVLGRDAPPRMRWFVASLLFALFWAGSPSQRETFYWLSASVDYGLPFLLLMAGLHFLARAGATSRGAAYAAGAGAAGFLASGAHEFAGMLLLAAALLRLATCWRLGRNRDIPYLLMAVVPAAVGLAIVMFAPGNAERASHFPMRGNLARAVGQTFRLAEAPLEWLLDIRLWALSALLLLLPAFRSLRPPWLSAGVPWPFLLPLGTLAAILASHLLAAYVIGFPPPGRMLSLLYALFILGWLATLQALAARLAAPRRAAASPLPAAAAAAAFALSLIASPNSIAAARGLVGVAEPWLRQNALQAQSARQQISLGKRDLVLPVITAVPAPLMRQGLTDDPHWWMNACMARHLRVGTVRAPPGEGKRTRRTWRGER